ncbi:MULTISPECIES: AEC family transporter [unclassified Pseudomonas]|uniref:AEC family transporter n=1 Tax=unclassified Pseudomonas TaxID=196821 RepID=UPI0019457A0F|nr:MULTISPECIES: AEC family transporter [unclassified Pseudomonas]MCE0914106.1 AEC family transporter [Pseudomonas sp. NMI760_13]BDU09834.1 transporter [Pseudomonas sp. RtIB026]
MLHLLLTTLVPIILLITLGTWLRVRGFLAETFWPGAERLSYYVLLPSLFLHGLATANLDGVPVLGMVGVLMLSTLLGALLLVLYQGVANYDGADFTSVFQGGVRFNNYIGATLAAGIYGTAGIALAAVANAAIVPLVNLLCVLVFARFSARHSSPAVVLQAIFANPLIIGCAGGLLLRLTGVGLPAGLEPTVKALGQAALPLGLLCVGAALGGARIGQQAKPLVVSALFKFLVMPLTTWALCQLLGLGGQAAVVAVLFQALPTASSSYVMARQMGGNAPLMATIIALQTIIAAVTLPMVLTLALS